AAEAGMDMPTLASLLGHSKLNMVMRYAHPQERHQVDAVRRLEAANAAKEIAEFEGNNPTAPEVPTVSPTVERLPMESDAGQSEDKSSRVNQLSVEARRGFEPLDKGFADLSLSHLGTSP